MWYYYNIYVFLKFPWVMSCIKFCSLFSPFSFYFDFYHFDSNREIDSNVVRTTGPEVRWSGLNSSPAITSVWPRETPYFLCILVSLSVTCRFLSSLLCCWSRNWVNHVKCAQQCLTQKELSNCCSFLLLFIKDCPWLSITKTKLLNCFFLSLIQISTKSLLCPQTSITNITAWEVDLESLVIEQKFVWLFHCKHLINISCCKHLDQLF